MGNYLHKRGVLFHEITMQINQTYLIVEEYYGHKLVFASGKFLGVSRKRPRDYIKDSLSRRFHSVSRILEQVEAFLKQCLTMAIF